jgi:hypothetical protein
MIYTRVLSNGVRQHILDGASPDDTERLDRAQASPRFPWRETLLKNTDVCRIALAPEIARQCDAVSKEPCEQMFAWHGIQQGDTFYVLHTTPIDCYATSSRVSERGVVTGRDQLTALQLHLLSEAVPENRCILAHNHPFTEATKLKRLGYMESEIQALQEEAITRMDLGFFPHLQNLRGDLRQAAALNELISSILSPEDRKFSGEGFQMLIWENPASEVARLSAFRIDADLHEHALDEVLIIESLPSSIQPIQERWSTIEQAIAQAAIALIEKESTARDLDHNPQPYYMLEDFASAQLCTRFGESLKLLARGQINLPQLLAEVRA